MDYIYDWETSLQGALNGKGRFSDWNMFLVLYPFKHLGVVALCKLSSKQLNSKACKHQH